MEGKKQEVDTNKLSDVSSEILEEMEKFRLFSADKGMDVILSFHHPQIKNPMSYWNFASKDPNGIRAVMFALDEVVRSLSMGKFGITKIDKI